MIFEENPTTGNKRFSMFGMYNVIQATSEMSDDELRELIANFAALAEFSPKSYKLFKVGLSEVLVKSLERTGVDTAKV